MSNVIYVRTTDPGVAEILRAAFPGFHGNRVQVIFSNVVRFTGTQWSEGNKREYQIVRLTDRQCVPISEAPFLQRSALHESDFTLPPEYVVVVHVYAGQRESCEIIAPPESIVAALPAPRDLTKQEEIVLLATRCLKSSYGGVPNYRFATAHRRYGITQEEWDSTKLDLFARGYLDKRGAITIEGKNAISGKYW